LPWQTGSIAADREFTGRQPVSLALLASLGLSATGTGGGQPAEASVATNRRVMLIVPLVRQLGKAVDPDVCMADLPKGCHRCPLGGKPVFLPVNAPRILRVWHES
jgi:hypothetical protein